MRSKKEQINYHKDILPSIKKGQAQTPFTFFRHDIPTILKGNENFAKIISNQIIFLLSLTEKSSLILVYLLHWGYQIIWRLEIKNLHQVQINHEFWGQFLQYNHSKWKPRIYVNYSFPQYNIKGASVWLVWPPYWPSSSLRLRQLDDLCPSARQ